MPIAFSSEFHRHFTVGLFENIADIPQMLTAVILDSVEVVGMDEFDEKVGYVIDGIFVPELEFAHAALGQLVENQADRVIIRYRAPQSVNHLKPLVSIDVSKERVLHANSCRRWRASR